MRANGLTRVEANADAERAWTEEVVEISRHMLFSKVDSWMMGVNSNLPGKRRGVLVYAGGAPKYRARCDEVAAAGYVGFAFA
jgi:hypothetical protein